MQIVFLMILNFSFLLFPFAADEWTVEASQAIVELTQYRTLQAQIASYTDTGLPEIHLYSYLSPNVSKIRFPVFLLQKIFVH